MKWKRFGLVALLSAVGFGTAACTDGYGYSGVGLGYGSGYYADPYYGDPYYAGVGGVGGSFGWYDNFYYPGTGVYVYDRYRRPHRWNDGQRRYWQSRPGWNGSGARANWNDFRRDYRAERRDLRGDLRDNRRAYRDGTINREQFREGRRDARREFRRDVRRDYRDLRRDNRADGVRTPRFNRNPGVNRGPGFRRNPGFNRGGGRGGEVRGNNRPR